MVCRHCGGNQFSDTDIFASAGNVQFLQLSGKHLIVHLYGLRDEDMLIFRRSQALLVHETLLMELLAWPETGVRDGDIHVGLVASEANEPPCRVIYAHRIAHVQHEDLPAPCVADALEQQAHGFGDGHELAGKSNILVRPRLLPPRCPCVWAVIGNHRSPHSSIAFAKSLMICHKGLVPLIGCPV